MSLTEPTTATAPPAGARPSSDGRVPAAQGRGLAARVERLATRRNGLALLGLCALAALGLFLLRPTYPNYDSYYTLL